MLFLSLLIFLGFGLLNRPLPGPASVASDPAAAGLGLIPTDRAVYLVGGISGDNLMVLTAAVAAHDPSAVVLLDTPASALQNKVFLQTYQPQHIIPVGAFPEGIDELEDRLEIKTDPVVPWQRGPPLELWKRQFAQADRVVVCPDEPRPLLLQAACLAGVLGAPLYPVHEETDQAHLRQQLIAWRTRHVFAVGAAAARCEGLCPFQTIRLADAEAVAVCYLRHQLRKGPIHTLVVTNPGDLARGCSDMSSLAPWVALHHRAALLLTNEAGDNVNGLVNAALEHRALQRADALIVLADLKAIPMQERPNPIAAGKDAVIEMEPLTPTGTDAFSFATGRLFHEDASVVVLMLARQLVLSATAVPRNALVVSNPTGGLPLLEAFSRNTVKELLNGGYQTTALFGSDVKKDDLRRLLPDQDIFLWEGHYSTLTKEYGIHQWDEPMRPTLVFLQSCLALSESKAQPFLQRGAVAVVGSSTRTYSGTGGACALAFFDALLYEDQSVGGCLRHAKNFLLAYSLLKEKRLGPDARLSGANLRSAWAFTLWGDPTLKLPRMAGPEDALPPIRHTLVGNSLTITLPDETHARATSARYKAQMWPNGRLAGLLTKDDDGDGKVRLVPLIFEEVHLPRGAGGMVPRLHSLLPSSRWVFCWDRRRCCGYLLAEPRAKDRHEIRFHITWEYPAAIEARARNNPLFDILKRARGGGGATHN
jgi:hypothetical protein